MERIFYLNLTDKDFRLRTLEILNGVGKLKQKERTVFLSFCELYDKTLTPDILTPDNRKEICLKLNMSSNHLNNVISELKKKEAIVYDSHNNSYYLNPLLIPSKDIDEIIFKLTYH